MNTFGNFGIWGQPRIYVVYSIHWKIYSLNRQKLILDYTFSIILRTLRTGYPVEFIFLLFSDIIKLNDNAEKRLKPQDVAIQAKHSYSSRHYFRHLLAIYQVIARKFQMHQLESSRQKYKTQFQTIISYIVLDYGQNVLETLAINSQIHQLDSSRNTYNKVLYILFRQFQIEQLGSSRFISQTVIDLLARYFYNLDSSRYYSQKVLDILLGRQFQIYLLDSSRYTIQKVIDIMAGQFQI